MKRKVIIGLVFVSVLVIGLIIFVISFFSEAMYQPGMVRAKTRLDAPLVPPVEDNVEDNFWQVTRDITLYYFKDGQGAPVLVLQGGPGFPYNSPKKALSLLNDQYTFYYYHQRGGGKSTRPFDRFESSNYYENTETLERMLGLGANIADIERIRRLLKVEKLILIGHSYGGFMATLYAMEFPEHVEKLVLVSPASLLVMPSKSGGLFEILRRNIDDKQLLAKYGNYLERLFAFGDIFNKDEKYLADLYFEFRGYWSLISRSKYPDTYVAEGMLRKEDVGGWPFYACSFSTGRKCDYTKGLANVTMPVMILHGEKDLVPFEDRAVYFDNLPHAEVHIVQDTGHFLLNENPELIADLISEFLK